MDAKPKEPAMVVTVLNALPDVLGGALVLFMLYGFWQGLGLRPHSPEHRPSEQLHLWWGPRN